MEHMRWTWDDLMDAPDDVVADLRAMWAAEVQARRIRKRRSG